MAIAKRDGIEIAYEVRGTGEPLALVAGLGMQLVQWPDGFLDKLVERGFQVIVLDNRDVGLSTKLDAAGRPNTTKLFWRALFGMRCQAPYTCFDMADDVVSVLDALAIPSAHVAGVSLGGMIVQAMALRHPDRVTTLTSMMSHSGGRVLTGRAKPAMKLMRASRNPDRTREEAIASEVDFFQAAGSTTLFRDDKALAERAGRAYDRGFNPAGVARQYAALLATGDLRKDLATLAIPTLVLHGTSDGVFLPRSGRETAAAIPGAQFRLIEGWGHDVAEGAWDILADALAEHALAKKDVKRPSSAAAAHV